MELLAVVGLGVVVFASTNIDDIFILMVFFANPAFRASHVVAGQYLGIAALTGVSMVGAMVALVIPDTYIGLLGLIPIVLGVRQLWALRSDGDSFNALDEREHAAVAAHSQVIGVSAVTIANGGDNIGIYVPLFASVDAARFGVMVAVFAVMTAVWCGIAYGLVHHSAAGASIRRYGHIVMPFVLIALGGYILVSQTVIR